jgi:hypothetical protein
MNVNSISLQQNISANYNNKQSAKGQITDVTTNQDTVTISNAARQLSISEDTRSENVERMNKKLDRARNDPVYAKELARGLAHSDFLMGIDVSTISEGGSIAVTRYTNGDLVNRPSTINSVQKWQNEAKQYKAENIELYNLENKKGTSDLNIIMKVMERNMGLPESFRKQQGNDYL